MYLKVKRNGTLIGTGNNSIASIFNVTASWYAFTIDAPASTAALTYEIFFCNDDNTATVQFLRTAGGSNGATMTVSEITP